MAFEDIDYQVVNGVARLTLNRPDRLNALRVQTLKEILDALTLVESDENARALLISGNGRGFCSGADLSSPGTPPGPNGEIDGGWIIEHHYNPIIEALSALPVPVVASVHGAVAGAGCSIALAADFVVAARSAFFLLAFVNVGLVPDAGATWLLPRIIGRHRALSMMMLGEKLPAAQAFDWGLVHTLVEDDHAQEPALALAERLAQGPTRAYALIRQGVRMGLETGLTETLRAERVAQRTAAQSADHREALAAFRAKRPARFNGT